MPKLTSKEGRDWYAVGERVLQERFPGPMRRLWEIIKPKGTRYLVIAGYQVTYRNRARLIILQIIRNGWIIYAAPHTNDVDETYRSICGMWYSNDGSNPRGEALTATDEITKDVVLDATPKSRTDRIQ